ncbi:MAG: 50S ribosomal protein L11 methyltransferase [Epsilonproteobacteria bacterium]|nr:50S ribosomal protein L11 methyltransferase [Campylobacterota bacterium]NPA56416.1 50S ribosomal protein L11 methyltransferase [Campylobacterota bacterium]
MDRGFYYEYRITADSFLPEIESFLMDRFYNGIEEQGETLILRSEEPLEEIIGELEGYIASLQELFGKRIEYTVEREKRENIDWIERYRASITPVEVGSFSIRPSWHPKREGKIDIEIDPALAFGSGHHESTRGCLRAIERYTRPGQTFLDVGCGSGILGIAAAKLGATVDICDTDELALRESRKNFAANGVTYRRGWVGSVAHLQEKYDIVTANIVADILVMIGDDLKRALKEEGILILSGIIEKYEGKVAQKFSDLTSLQKIREGEWVTMIFQKDSDEQRAPEGSPERS